MLRSYTALNKEHSETVVSLAEKITELVVSSSVMYGEADEALNVALEMLETKTRPLNVPQQGVDAFQGFLILGLPVQIITPGAAGKQKITHVPWPPVHPWFLQQHHHG